MDTYRGNSPDPTRGSARAGPLVVVQQDSSAQSRRECGNPDYPVAIHGAGRAADEADHTIGCATAARTRLGFGALQIISSRSHRIRWCHSVRKALIASAPVPRDNLLMPSFPCVEPAEE